MSECHKYNQSHDFKAQVTVCTSIYNVTRQ